MHGRGYRPTCDARKSTPLELYPIVVRHVFNGNVRLMVGVGSAASASDVYKVRPQLSEESGS